MLEKWINKDLGDTSEMAFSNEAFFKIQKDQLV